MAKDFERIRKVQSSDQLITQLHSNIDTAFSNIQKEPYLRGVLLQNISLTGGSANVLTHGLGRNYVGFIVARLSADARVWESTLENKSPSTQIILTCNNSCRISVVVF